MPAQKRPVVAVDRLTGQVTARFDSVQDAAEAIGMKATNVCQECRNRRVPNTRFDVLRYADDKEPIDWGTVRGKCIVATDGRTVHAWTCANRAAEDSSLTYHGIKWRIVRGAKLDLLGREMLARYVDRPLNINAKVVRHV